MITSTKSHKRGSMVSITFPQLESLLGIEGADLVELKVNWETECLDFKLVPLDGRYGEGQENTVKFLGEPMQFFDVVEGQAYTVQPLPFPLNTPSYGRLLLLRKSIIEFIGMI